MDADNGPKLIPVEVVLEGAEIPSYSFLAKRMNAALETRGRGYVPAEVTIISPLSAMIYALPVAAGGSSTGAFYGLDQTAPSPDSLAYAVNEMTDDLRVMGREVMRHFLFSNGAILWTYEKRAASTKPTEPIEDVFAEAKEAARRASAARRDEKESAAKAPEAAGAGADRAPSQAALHNIASLWDRLNDAGFAREVLTELGPVAALSFAAKMHERACELHITSVRSAKIQRVLYALDTVYRLAGMTLAHLAHQS